MAAACAQQPVHPTIERETRLMSSPSTAIQSADEVSDEDLLIQMAIKDSEPDKARAAWAVFYARHHEYLARQSYKVLDSFLGSRYDGRAKFDMSRDVAADILIRAYERAETFELKGARGPGQVRSQVRGWLGEIGHNMVCDWLNQRRHETGEETLDSVPEEESLPVENADFLQCVGEAVDKLQEKERRVLAAFATFFNPATGRGRLSNEMSADLAHELGMTPTSLRQVRRRALKRLKEFIQANCKQHAPRNFPW
jgi:RNA polymerase sigma factor (sigma-70 family)